MNEVQLVILKLEAYTVGVGNRHDSLSLALDRIAARNIPQVKVALGLLYGIVD